MQSPHRSKKAKQTVAYAVLEGLSQIAEEADPRPASRARRPRALDRPLASRELSGGVVGPTDCLDLHSHFAQPRNCAASKEFRDGRVIAVRGSCHGRQEAIWSLELHQFAKVRSNLGKRHE